MKIEKLLDLAGQHVEATKASQKAIPPPCLSDEDILRVTQLVDDSDDDEAATNSLESILGIFFNPTDDRRGIRVSPVLLFPLGFYVLQLCTYVCAHSRFLKRCRHDRRGTDAVCLATCRSHRLGSMAANTSPASQCHYDGLRFFVFS